MVAFLRLLGKSSSSIFFIPAPAIQICKINKYEGNFITLQKLHNTKILRTKIITQNEKFFFRKDKHKRRKEISGKKQKIQKTEDD